MPRFHLVMLTSLMLTLAARARAGAELPPPSIAGETLAQRMAQRLRWNTDGVTGAYLKQVQGPVLCDLQSSYVFEPASAIKALIAVHALRAVASGALTLDTPLDAYTAREGSCPLDSLPRAATLRALLHGMLKVSDNACTQALRAYFGQDAIDSTAAALGLAHTALAHRIGCGDSALVSQGRLTLADAGNLYEKIATAQALASPWCDTLRAYLDNAGDTLSYATWFRGRLWTIVGQEAAALGADSSWARAFEQRMHFAFKAGNYWLCPGASCAPGVHDASVAGWLSLPGGEAPGGPAPREFVFGTFVANAASDSSAMGRVADATPELFRAPIRAALARELADAEGFSLVLHAADPAPWARSP